MKIVQEDDREKLEKLTGEALSRTILKYSNEPHLVLLAGGSALAVLSHVDISGVSEKTTIAMTDERFSSDPAVNNFSQFTQTDFYSKASAANAKFIDSRVGTDESLETFGERLDSAIQNWLSENPNGSVIGLFGIGEDGHTAGIMPFPENPAEFDRRFLSKKNVCAYDAGQKSLYPLRATLTETFLKNNVTEKIFFAYGEKKKEAIEKVLAKKGTLTETPARALREGGEVILFSDFNQ